MDVIAILLFAIFCCLRSGDAETITTVQTEAVALETRLNPEFYEDPNAFMLVANALGFN